MACLLASEKKLESSLIHDRPCLLGGIAVVTDGSNAVTVTVYDSDTNDIIGQKTVWSNTDAGASNYGGVFFVVPIKMERGIYVTVSGAGGGYRVYEYKL